MIDMRGMEHLTSYQDAKAEFIATFPNATKCHELIECKWGLFKQSFFEKSKSKCPICEDTLNRYDDIDHYRPQVLYPFLRCCCDNYMVMCQDCNRAYKRANFPVNGKKASSISDVPNEKPLLINPRVDNVLEYFELYFVPRRNGKKVLELRPKKGLDSEMKKRADETIKLFGIGQCDVNMKIDDCRINILELHYESFIKLAEAKTRDQEAYDELKKDPDLEKKLEYGFIHFIDNNQFTVIKI